MNPYYDPQNLGLEMISFDEPDMSYEFNICAFFRTPDGRVFMAQDSGCSCPTPFEDYDANSMDAAVQQMTRIANVVDAVAQLRSWGKSYSGRSWITNDDVRRLRAWFAEVPVAD